MQNFVNRTGLDSQIYCDSAGVIGYHAGERADARMISHAQKRGYELKSISRQFRSPQDFEEFDIILVMDENNFGDITSLDEQGRFSSKVKRMTEFCRNRSENVVPDPYYGGEAGFEQVLDILEDACQGLLEQVSQELK